MVVNIFHALLEAVLDGFDDLIEGKAALQVLLRRPANFTIDDTVFG